MFVQLLNAVRSHSSLILYRSGMVQDEVGENNMVLCLEDAVAILNKWKDESAQILVVSESPFQQSRRGILEQDIDWSIGLQGKVKPACFSNDGWS